DCSADAAATVAAVAGADQTPAADGASPVEEMVAGTSTTSSAQCLDPQAQAALVALCAQLASAPPAAPSYVATSTVRPVVAAGAATAQRRAATSTPARQTASSTSSSASSESGSVRQFAS